MTNSDFGRQFAIFFCYCFVVVCVVIFFSFYFNRLQAYILSRIIRAYTWRKFKIYIDIGMSTLVCTVFWFCILMSFKESLQITLLGGRIIFKNFRYHSQNLSVYVLKGHITFRYWLWNVRSNDSPAPEQGVCLCSAVSLADSY